MQKRKTKKRIAARTANPGQRLTPWPEANDFIPGPKLRSKLGISAVTLWRWRHDGTSDFPAAKVINGRLYFPLDAVSNWLARQPEAA